MKNYTSYWRRPTSILTFFYGLILTIPAFSATTRIVSINGNYQYTHEQTIQVQPGDVVSLMADSLQSDGLGTETPLNIAAEYFTWSTDRNSNDICSPNWDCVGTSFEPHEYGVNFYVPNDLTSSLTLTVYNETDGSYDQIRIQNTNPISQPVYNPNPSTPVIEDPDYDNDNSDFDYNRHLNGYGRWVYIDGERVFVPYNYTSEWRPYRHGYWYWSRHGWTWYSYDPWGWVTDHYGVWRNHGTYGWVWLPFPVITYRPHCVTFFHHNDGIGWSPYYSGYNYSRGYDRGYRDGYWDGYRAGLINSSYNPGFSFVHNRDFTNINIVNVTVTNVTVVNNYYNTAIVNNNYGVNIGMQNNVQVVDPRQFVERRGCQVREVAVREVMRNNRYGGGGVAVVRPIERPQVPQQYVQARQQAFQRRSGALPPAPVGAVQDPNTGVVHGPREYGRNVATPPVRRNGTPVNPVGRPPMNPAPRPTNPNRPQPGQPMPGRPSEPARPMPGRPSEPARPMPQPNRPQPGQPMPGRPSEPARPMPQPNRPQPGQPMPGRPSEPARPMPGRPSEPARPMPQPNRPQPQPPMPGRPQPGQPMPNRPAPAPAPRPGHGPGVNPAPNRPQPGQPAPQRPGQPPNPGRRPPHGGG